MISLTTQGRKTASSRIVVQAEWGRPLRGSEESLAVFRFYYVDKKYSLGGYGPFGGSVVWVGRSPRSARRFLSHSGELGYSGFHVNGNTAKVIGGSDCSNIYLKEAETLGPYLNRIAKSNLAEHGIRLDAEGVRLVPGALKNALWGIWYSAAKAFGQAWQETKAVWQG